ncbi:hypothetical protein ACRQ1B_13730 [Rhizobium panacihumi]|uniref:hypothetical protein n=1 Tax=Rhizobium panacihumi TaxID=2008450 RepID=UPI003D796339
MPEETTSLYPKNVSSDFLVAMTGMKEMKRRMPAKLQPVTLGRMRLPHVSQTLVAAQRRTEMEMHGECLGNYIQSIGGGFKSRPVRHDRPVAQRIERWKLFPKHLVAMT